MRVATDGCLSRRRTRVSPAAAWVLALLLAPLADGGLGAGRRVQCRTLSSAFDWVSGGVRSPNTHTHTHTETKKSIRLSIRQPDVDRGIITSEEN